MAHGLFVDSSKVRRSPDPQIATIVFDDKPTISFQDEPPLDSPYTIMIPSSVPLSRSNTVNRDSVVEKSMKKKHNQAYTPHLWVARRINSHVKRDAFTSAVSRVLNSTPMKGGSFFFSFFSLKNFRLC